MAKQNQHTVLAVCSPKKLDISRSNDKLEKCSMFANDTKLSKISLDGEWWNDFNEHSNYKKSSLNVPSDIILNDTKSYIISPFPNWWQLIHHKNELNPQSWEKLQIRRSPTKLDETPTTERHQIKKRMHAKIFDNNSSNKTNDLLFSTAQQSIENGDSSLNKFGSKLSINKDVEDITLADKTRSENCVVEQGNSGRKSFISSAHNSTEKEVEISEPSVHSQKFVVGKNKKFRDLLSHVSDKSFFNKEGKNLSAPHLISDNDTVGDVSPVLKNKVASEQSCLTPDKQIFTDNSSISSKSTLICDFKENEISSKASYYKPSHPQTNSNHNNMICLLAEKEIAVSSANNVQPINLSHQMNSHLDQLFLESGESVASDPPCKNLINPKLKSHIDKFSLDDEESLSSNLPPKNLIDPKLKSPADRFLLDSEERLASSLPNKYIPKMQTKSHKDKFLSDSVMSPTNSCHKYIIPRIKSPMNKLMPESDASLTSILPKNRIRTKIVSHKDKFLSGAQESETSSATSVLPKNILHLNVNSHKDRFFSALAKKENAKSLRGHFSRNLTHPRNKLHTNMFLSVSADEESEGKSLSSTISRNLSFHQNNSTSNKFLSKSKKKISKSCILFRYSTKKPDRNNILDQPSEVEMFTKGDINNKSIKSIESPIVTLNQKNMHTEHCVNEKGMLSRYLNDVLQHSSQESHISKSSEKSFQNQFFQSNSTRNKPNQDSDVKNDHVSADQHLFIGNETEISKSSRMSSWELNSMNKQLRCFAERHEIRESVSTSTASLLTNSPSTHKITSTSDQCKLIIEHSQGEMSLSNRDIQDKEFAQNIRFTDETQKPNLNIPESKPDHDSCDEHYLPVINKSMSFSSKSSLKALRKKSSKISRDKQILDVISDSFETKKDSFRLSSSQEPPDKRVKSVVLAPESTDKSDSSPSKREVNVCNRLNYFTELSKKEKNISTSLTSKGMKTNVEEIKPMKPKSINPDQIFEDEVYNSMTPTSEKTSHQSVLISEQLKEDMNFPEFNVQNKKKPQKNMSPTQKPQNISVLNGKHDYHSRDQHSLFILSKRKSQSSESKLNLRKKISLKKSKEQQFFNMNKVSLETRNNCSGLNNSQELCDKQSPFIMKPNAMDFWALVDSDSSLEFDSSVANKREHQPVSHMHKGLTTNEGKIKPKEKRSLNHIFEGKVNKPKRVRRPYWAKKVYDAVRKTINTQIGRDDQKDAEKVASELITLVNKTIKYRKKGANPFIDEVVRHLYHSRLIKTAMNYICFCMTYLPQDYIQKALIDALKNGDDKILGTKLHEDLNL